MFVGRDYQLKLLSSVWDKESSSLVVVSGRRRIGKSTLIERFAEKSRCRFIEIEGLPPDATMTNERQLANFCERIGKSAQIEAPQAKNWAEAFDFLDKVITGKSKVIVFLDEISWMGGYDDGFAGLLKNAWDMQLSKHKRLVLVLAGSVSAWIQKNILNAKGFVGRVSIDLNLTELPLSACCSFWGRRTTHVSMREMVDILSVTGGIPKYLQEINPRLSADENIRRMCFLPEGYLFKDFDSIFSDVFGEGIAAKRRILNILADGPASVSELAKAMSIEPNGHITNDLNDLTVAGFVAAGAGLNPVTNAKVREVRYRLCDNYTRFYLKFIQPRREAIRQGLYRFADLESLPGWNSILGLQFENLVVNNLASLCRELGLGRKLVTSAAPYARRKSAACPGLQIDLLIQTPKSVYVIEVKRCNRIETSIEKEIEKKVSLLGIGSGKSIRTALVYDGKLSPEVEENGFIDFLIPFNRLMEASDEP
jgi:AAA+ ATPase superfamily predicted ATPase